MTSSVRPSTRITKSSPDPKPLTIPLKIPPTCSGITKPAKMAHLHLKRFQDLSLLTPGARRNRAAHPHEVVADYAPTARAACKMCALPIPKHALRFTLMLQCHKGYKMPAVVHSDCFAAHPETAKLENRREIHLDAHIQESSEDVDFVWKAVDSAIASTPSSTRDTASQRTHE